LTRAEIVKKLVHIEERSIRPQGKAFAPANIALCKYWGKRDKELNLPITSSLSVSLGALGTETVLSLTEEQDIITLNGQRVDGAGSFARRLTEFLDLFRLPGRFFQVETINTIPTGAGLASSASGFAALVCALRELLQLNIDSKSLSILARLGSGSACRSLYNGFVEWRAGELTDGMDSYAEPLPDSWPEMRLGVVMLTEKEKPHSSRDAMNRTTETSLLYKQWPGKVEKDLLALKTAIREKDFALLGKTAESNALAMHATMLDAWPPVLYWLPETIAIFKHVWELREQNVEVYFTIDAGPNVKLLFLQSEIKRIEKVFKNVYIIAPFG